MNNYQLIALIPLLPLAGFVMLGLFGRKYFKSASGWLGCFLLLASFILSVYYGYEYFFVNGKVGDVYLTIIPFKYPWLQFTPGLSIDMGILLDPISVMMILIITFVSLMVHVYSLSYMKGEERFSTYYSFLALFTFSMLGLVLSSNLFETYIFWELVGISSYLLIGFYYDRPSAVAAAKKAFIVTRFADLGFLIGILILSFNGNSLDIQTLIQRFTSAQSSAFISATTSSFLGLSILTWALTLIFIGGAGKSAMFPLHIWLPDAMEGPTPVSALIHAATMVVAGVYLVARLFPVYEMIPAVLQLITFVGIFSALFTAIIACTQTDIKRVLAYSTISQIGYMMFALGLSGFTASMFHLFTHAFFKALLFLCAGAIIHFVHSNELKDMGGLKKRMPLTHITFLIACLAISGIPPFAGFFSKEEILFTAWNANRLVYFLALLTSGLTAFYMFRLYFDIFWNKNPASSHPELVSGSSHESEGNFSIKFPLIILAIGAIFAGFIPFSDFVFPAVKPFNEEAPATFSILPVLIAVCGITIAYLLYFRENDRSQKISAALGSFYKAAYQKFYVDELYLFLTKKVIFNLIGKPAAWIDRNVVDGTMNGIAFTTEKVSSAIKGVQSGKLQGYAIYFLAGIICLILIFVYWWK